MSNDAEGTWSAHEAARFRGRISGEIERREADTSARNTSRTRQGDILRQIFWVCVGSSTVRVYCSCRLAGRGLRYIATAVKHRVLRKSRPADIRNTWRTLCICSTLGRSAGRTWTPEIMLFTAAEAMGVGRPQVDRDEDRRLLADAGMNFGVLPVFVGERALVNGGIASWQPESYCFFGALSGAYVHIDKTQEWDDEEKEVMTDARFAPLCWGGAI